MARRYGDRTGDYRSDTSDRWRDEDRERSTWRSGGQGTSEREDERGFFERAGDEIKSWFSDEDEDRYGRDYERGRSSSDWTGRSSWDRDTDRSSRSYGGGISDRDRERSFGRIGRGGTDYMSEDRGSFGGMAQGGMSRSSGSRDRDRERGFGPSRGGGQWSSPERGDRSRMGGYGEGQLRSSERQGFGRRERGFGEDERERGRTHPQSWGEANRGSNESLGYGDFQGTLGGFGNQRFGSSQDDHYRSWRDRQMSQLDEDYSDYCREREQQFHSDFDSWRRNRQSQRPSPTSPTSDLGANPNAGVGTTTSSITGTAGAGSAVASGTTSSSSIESDTTGSTETAGTGSGRSGPRSRS